MTPETSKLKANHVALEEEETTTDGEDSKSMEVVAETSENEDESESDEEDVLIPEPLAPNRLKRSNAGNRMAELMSSAITDDFYESAYGGGFKEDDVDDNFAPVDDNMEEDEIDSDFDHPEEDEPASGGEEANNEEAQIKRAEKKKLLAKNRNWAVARFNKFTVNQNIVDAKTQKQRLAESKETEKLNIASLKRFEEFELERKKKHAKPSHRQQPLGPIITTISKSEPTPSNIVIVPQIKQFEKPERREYRVCAVTGRPARYIDPLTDLPYADLNAFRQIRDSYKTYLKSVSQLPESVTDVGIVEQMEVSVAKVDATR